MSDYRDSVHPTNEGAEPITLRMHIVVLEAEIEELKEQMAEAIEKAKAVIWHWDNHLDNLPEALESLRAAIETLEGGKI